MKTWIKTEYLNPHGGTSIGVTDRGLFVAKSLTNESANLISAAPELLEALEASLKLNELHFSIAEKFTPEFCDGNSPLEKAIKSAKEAITKARG